MLDIWLFFGISLWFYSGLANFALKYTWCWHCAWKPVMPTDFTFLKWFGSFAHRLVPTWCLAPKVWHMATGSPIKTWCTLNYFWNRSYFLDDSQTISSKWSQHEMSNPVYLYCKALAPVCQGYSHSRCQDSFSMWRHCLMFYFLLNINH